MRAGDDMPRRERGRRRERRPGRGRIVLVVLAVALFLLVTTLRSIASFYTDYLWFDSVHQTGVWRGVLGTKLLLAISFIAIFFILLWLNLYIADRIAPKFRPAGPEEELIERYHELVGRRQGILRIGVALLFAVIAGAGAGGQWNEWILFRNHQTFGIQDPQFHKDVGFYVFQLPFLTFVVGWLFAAFTIIFIVTAVAHYLNGGIRVQTPFQRVTPQVKAHLSVLLAVLALVKAAGYYLQQFELTTSTRGTVDGATYTDIHAQLPAIRLLLVISLFSVFLFLYNIFRRGWVLPVLGVALWLFVAVVAGSIVPAFMQKFRVEPSESSKERAFIERNIEATRHAFNLDQVKVTDFRNDNALNTQALLANSPTVDNIRLWDPNIMPQTYQELQARFPFYRINDVDVDRYNINGAETQVVLSARELNTSGVPQSSWEGTHLAFTHGYGLILSSANAQTPSGQPDLLVRDIPVTDSAGVPVQKAGVYFGERLDGYVITNTKRQEIDYEDQAGNPVFTQYTGQDGIPIGSWLRRAAFALRFGDFNPLVSGNITGSSKILINRDINARLDAIAPFLTWDSDPYPVAVGGRLQWVVDGYTTTDMYPYAQRATSDNNISLQGRFNYVRNSVKAVIDAYDGTTTIYVVDPNDPIIRAYQKAFPQLLTSAAPPEELRAHFRYPEDMFRVQTNMWGRYHLDNPDDFYTQGAAWSVAPDPGTSVQTQSTTPQTTPQDSNVPSTAGNRIAPYYQLMRLPGETGESFLILRPFVPTKGSNQQMTAFMIAKSDPGSYGQLQTYEMPGNNLPPAPNLVASNMSSDPAVSGLQTLLGVNSGGSRLLFGNLLTVPIEQSLVYVRPVYVQSTGENNPPLLREVIVQYNGTVHVAPTLTEALKLFPEFASLPGESSTTPTSPDQVPTNPGQTTPPGAPTVGDLLTRANQDFADANAALQKNPPDYATYGQKLQDAQTAISQALSLANGTSPPPSSSTSTTTSTTTTTTTVPSGGSALGGAGPRPAPG